MGYWAKPPMAREQIALFAPTLEETIAEDHPVRLLDEILGRLNWTDWEAEYDGRRGQPPIHPRTMAGVLLYGLSRGIRSSRQLEYLIGNNLDFIWLAEGRRIDYSTLCGFRKQFRGPLKDLFRQVCRIAMTMGLVRLNEVTLDGTRVKANNARREMLTAAGLEQRLAALDAELEKLFAEAEAADAAEALLFDTGAASQALPAELARLQTRREELQKAMAEVQAADKARKSEGIDPAKKPAHVPTTDVDSKLLPNKEGGFAPNYTPLVAVDAHRGFLVDAEVIRDTSEQLETVPTVDRIEANLGQKPEKMLADGLHATGENLRDLDERGVELFSPLPSHQPQPGNPALRADPTQPVPEAERERLPRNPQSKKLDKACFVYDEAADCYYCPQGRVLAYEETKSNVPASGRRIYFRVYRCGSCEGCPQSAACRRDNARQGRSISRDAEEGRRERHAAKMATAEAKTVYKKRLHAAETPFAILKQVMRLRQFLLRGLEHVKTEWLWACAAFNVNKLAREAARLRAKFAEMIATPEV